MTSLRALVIASIAGGLGTSPILACGSSGSSTSGVDADAATGTTCQKLQCVAPQVCCALRTGVMMAPNVSCQSTCAAANTVMCFGEDCTTGQVCCGTSGSSQPLGSACLTACTTSGAMQRLVCKTVADCPAGYTCSGNSSTSSTGGLYRTCHPPNSGPI